MSTLLAALIKEDVIGFGELYKTLYSIIDDYVTCDQDQFLDHSLRELKQDFNAISMRQNKASLAGELNDIIATLREKRLLTKKPIAAFLATKSASKDCHSQNLNALKALLVVAGNYCLVHFDERERVNRAFASYRLIIENRQEQTTSSLIELLPCFSQPFEFILTDLSELIKPETPQFNNRLYPIKRVIEDAFAEELVRRRQKKIKKAINEATLDASYITPTLFAAEKAQEYELNEHSKDNLQFTELTSTIPEIHKQPDKNSVETLVDDQQDEKLLSVTVPNITGVRESAFLSKASNQNILSQIEKRSKLLATSTTHLTVHEIRTFIIATIQHKRVDEKLAFILLWMLLTGRRFDALKKAQQLDSLQQAKSNKPGDYYIIKKRKMIWLYIAELPNHNLNNSDLKQLVDQQFSPVILTLPMWFRELFFDYEHIPDLDDELYHQLVQFLKKVNEKKNTHLTLVRVADYLNYFLHRNGTDSVDIALITGKVSVQEAGVYYYQYDVKDLNKHYQNYIQTVSRLANFKISRSQQMNSSKKIKGGSQLVVQLDTVKVLFKFLKTTLSQPCISYAEFHNYYTLLSLLILNLSTGHRPVDDQYDDLSHFDLLGKKIFISDKEGRSALAARTLVLPNIGIKQMEYYLDHLESLKTTLYFTETRIVHYIDTVLSGHAPVFFFLEENESLRIKRSCPRVISEFTHEYLDIPQNWYRHYLRTLLHKEKIPGEVIDVFMGHARSGEEGFSLFSGLSMQSLKVIASAIEKHLLSLNFHAMPGWNKKL